MPGVSVVVFFTKWCAEAVAGWKSSGSDLEVRSFVVKCSYLEEEVEVDYWITGAAIAINFRFSRDKVGLSFRDGSVLR